MPIPKGAAIGMVSFYLPGPRPWLPPLLPGCPASFVDFTATTAGSDFSSVVIGFGSSPSPCGPMQSEVSGEFPVCASFLLPVNHAAAGVIEFDVATADIGM